MDSVGDDGDIDLYCKLDNLSGLVGALTSIKWNKQQDAICDISEYGMIIIVEELNCLQGKVYFRKELFVEYKFQAEARSRFEVSLSLLVDCLNAFTSAAGSNALEIRYPGRDMQLLLKLTDADDTCTDAEIRTRVLERVPRDYALEEDGTSTPVGFAVRSQALKETLEDLEWPGSSIQVTISPRPPMVSFRAEGHGDLQIDYPYSPSSELFIDFTCGPQDVTFWYKYKYLRATTANIPNDILKDNRGSKLTIDANGLLKVQHIINIRPGGAQQQDNLSEGAAIRTSYIEFYLAPEEEVDHEDGGGEDRAQYS